MVARGRRLQPCAGEKGGSETGPSPVDRARNGSKHHLLVDATGIPLAWTVTGGNRNDVTQLIPLLERVPPVRGKVGRPRQRPERVTADRGYDHDKYRRELAADAWRASRVDVEQQTRNMHRSDLNRVFKVAPGLRAKRIDQIELDDVTFVIAALREAGYKRETIKKSRDALAMVVDHYGIDPNPVRDKRVRLPRERRPHVPPPLAQHVERVAETLPRHHVLPLLIVDECGPRVNELATAQVGDFDEHRRAIRVRWTVE